MNSSTAWSVSVTSWCQLPIHATQLTYINGVLLDLVLVLGLLPTCCGTVEDELGRLLSAVPHEQPAYSLHNVVGKLEELCVVLLVVRHDGNARKRDEEQ
jgi:hypothetical protein